ncbi:MAG: hypothetical protein PHE56_16005 [Bacteroidales bacterium]|nr:hypothetical protein [Bacteroidales bacterium]
MKAKLWIVIILMMFAYSGIAQQVMEFTQSKNTGDNKTVYFHIKGLEEDEEARTSLLNEFLKDENIISGRIFTSSTFKTRCQLLIPQNIKPEYIRNILLANGYDFDFTTISVNGVLKSDMQPETHISLFYSPAEGFPVMQSTGDKLKDREDYTVSKEKWVAENQRQYNKQKSKGTAEFPIVIEKKVFDSYTVEKQERLLAEPDKYIIK